MRPASRELVRSQARPRRTSGNHLLPRHSASVECREPDALRWSAYSSLAGLSGPASRGAEKEQDQCVNENLDMLLTRAVRQVYPCLIRLRGSGFFWAAHRLAALACPLPQYCPATIFPTLQRFQKRPRCLNPWDAQCLYSACLNAACASEPPGAGEKTRQALAVPERPASRELVRSQARPRRTSGNHLLPRHSASVECREPDALRWSAYSSLAGLSGPASRGAEKNMTSA
jgi:hypothetical protein